MKNVLKIKHVLQMEHHDRSAQSPGSVPALDRSLDLVELLNRRPEGLTLSELSKELAAPKNAIFRITQTLLARGYLSRDSESMSFQLTGQFLKLAPPQAGGISLPEATRPAMEALRDETGETVQLGVLSGLEGVVIDQVESRQALRIVVNLGLRFSLYDNAPGKLLLAHMPEEERAEAISKLELTPKTPRTITDQTKLIAECENIVSLGYSVDYAEADEGIHCVAAPIFGSNNIVVGTLWVTGPSKRLPKSGFRDLGEKVKIAGAQVSEVIERLG